MNIHHFRLFEAGATHPMSCGGVTIALEKYGNRIIIAYTRCSIRDRYSRKLNKVYVNLSKSLAACKSLIDNEDKITEDLYVIVRKKHSVLVKNVPGDMELAGITQMVAQDVFFRSLHLPPEEKEAIIGAGAFIDVQETHKKKKRGGL